MVTIIYVYVKVTTVVLTPSGIGYRLPVMIRLSETIYRERHKYSFHK